MCIPETGHTTARGRRFPNSPVSSTTFTSYTSAAPHHRGKNHISNIAQKTLPGEWLTRSGSLHLQHASFPVKQKTICSHWLGRRDLTGWRPVGLSGQYGDWIRRRVLKGLGNNRLPPHLAQKCGLFLHLQGSANFSCSVRDTKVEMPFESYYISTLQPTHRVSGLGGGTVLARTHIIVINNLTSTN